MAMPAWWRRVVKVVLRRHGPVKSFDDELRAAGGLAGRFDAGTRPVPTEKVVGSVGRAGTLRSDFFYRRGKAMTQRFVRVGQAMAQGKALPALELYKLKRRRQEGSAERDDSVYYVVDGHHRVAMAKKLGQAYLDAHVVEHKAAGGQAPSPSPSAPDAGPHTPSPSHQRERGEG